MAEYKVYLMELGLSPEEMQARIAREFPREASQAGSVALREASGSIAPRQETKLLYDVPRTQREQARAFYVGLGLSPEAAERRAQNAEKGPERRIAEALAGIGYRQHKAALDGDSLPPESVGLSEAERRTREALTRMGYGGHKQEEAGEAQAGDGGRDGLRLDRALSELRAR